MRFEHPHRRSVIHANHELQYSHEFNTAERPSGPEHPVIKILNTNPCIFFQHVEVVEKLLKVREADFPGTVLSANCEVKCCGSSTMAAACIEKNELDSQHATGSLAGRHPFHLTTLLKEHCACLNG